MISPNSITLFDKKPAKPFVKWVGGKSQLLPEILKKIPRKIFENKKPFSYVEPFVGGGAVLFAMLQAFPQIKKAVINDINPDLTATYRCVRDNQNALIKELEALQAEYLSLDKDSRKEFFLARREEFNFSPRDDLRTATLFIFLNRTCFNGLYRVNSKGAFNVPFGSYSNPKICDAGTILADSELLQRVEILTGDFAETLNHVRGNAFFYLDPPYKPLSATSSFNSYAKESFGDSEQIRLGEFCKKLDALGHRWILSNSDVRGKNPNDNFFDELYSQFTIQRVLASRMVNANPEKRGKLTELMVANF